MLALATEHSMPVENLLTPDVLRRTLWAPPATRDPGDLLDGVVDQLTGLGARPWQVALTAPMIVDAVLQADRRPPPEPRNRPAAEAVETDDVVAAVDETESGQDERLRWATARRSRGRAPSATPRRSRP